MPDHGDGLLKYAEVALDRPRGAAYSDRLIGRPSEADFVRGSLPRRRAGLADEEREHVALGNLE